MNFELHRGDCMEVLRGMADNSVDSVVTDPPYGLSDHKPGEVVACLTAWIAGKPYEPKGRRGFMGNSWDAWVPGPEVWREALRVLKPGGHALVFAGTRSMDLMCMALRLAGFELRDSIGSAHDGGEAPLMAWVYGSGFPKSHNGDWGGTALKPAWEPIILLRKPLVGTVAANYAAYGTGALNIDGCRVATNGEQPNGSGARESWRAMEGRTDLQPHDKNVTPDAGRWPANLIHDGSEEVLSGFPESTSGAMKAGTRRAAQDRPGSVCYGTYGGNAAVTEIQASHGSAARFFYCAKASKSDRDEGLDGFAKTSGGMVSNTSGQHMTRRDEGYQVASRANNHPTVKPTDLMRYLCRLVTPPGGVVLDPYMGSGSTGKAAILEGFRFVGIERDEGEEGKPLGYLDIARARITNAQKQYVESMQQKPVRDLFSDLDAA